MMDFNVSLDDNNRFITEDKLKKKSKKELIKIIGQLQKQMHSYIPTKSVSFFTSSPKDCPGCDKVSNNEAVYLTLKKDNEILKQNYEDLNSEMEELKLISGEWREFAHFASHVYTTTINSIMQTISDLESLLTQTIQRQDFVEFSKWSVQQHNNRSFDASDSMNSKLDYESPILNPQSDPELSLEEMNILNGMYKVAARTLHRKISNDQRQTKSRTMLNTTI